MSRFVEKLIENSRADIYPMHMPGHKRVALPFEENDAISHIRAIDITEIEGFDNLHAPEGIIGELQERIAGIFGVPKSLMLVNGSTCGVLAAISACVRPGGTILMARNSHISAYNAVNVGGLKSVYLYPEICEEGINGGIDPEDVRQALDSDDTIQAVFVTSPTYEGVISDIEKISNIAHDHGVPLIVDEAHGAHLSLCPSLEEKYGMAGAMQRGADIAVQSLHKTLPSFTQTAVLHYSPRQIDEDRLRRCVSTYQTTSPSYILMAGVDRCMDVLEKKGEALFAEYERNLEAFYEKAASLEKIKLLRWEDLKGKHCISGFDIGKLVMIAASGKGLYETLLREHGIQTEMYGINYCLAMTSFMDNGGAFDRLLKAVEECDKIYADGRDKAGELPPFAGSIRPRSVMTISRALNEELSGPGASDESYDPTFICRNFVFACPPGVPVMVPGELFTEEILDTLEAMSAGGIRMLYR